MEVSLKVKKQENDKFILQDDNHNLIYWPADKLPTDIKVGETIKFFINQSSAKTLLNELLKTDKTNN
jgi:predicted RNA-binding protein (virulence factor B family)